MPDPVLVPAARVARWVANFETRHGATELEVVDGALTGSAADGSSFRAVLPFAASYAGPPDPGSFVEAFAPPPAWGVLLVRKGGFAVARVQAAQVVESKIGQRHVQGRTKAGGQSQQRFARRRDNQARQAYEAAADHAARILGDSVALGVPPLPVVVGGDRTAVQEVLDDPRLGHLAAVGAWLAVPDPRRAVLDSAVADGCSAAFEVVNV